MSVAKDSGKYVVATGRPVPNPYNLNVYPRFTIFTRPCIVTFRSFYSIDQTIQGLIEFEFLTARCMKAPKSENDSLTSHAFMTCILCSSISMSQVGNELQPVRNVGVKHS